MGSYRLMVLLDRLDQRSHQRGHEGGRFCRFYDWVVTQYCKGWDGPPLGEA